MVRVLVVGQTPPPFLGQPIMLDLLVRSEMPDVELLHVGTRLSSDASEVGRFRWLKVLRLFVVVAQIYYTQIFRRAQVLYYPPAGPVRISMFRDIVILMSTRWMFPKTVFHFHAGGLSQLYDQLPAWQRWLFRRTYYYPDAAIRLSPLTPEDGKAIKARREYIVPNGIEDPCAGPLPPRVAEPVTAIRPLHILFVALLVESKGLMVLIDACGKLADRGIPSLLKVMGKFASEQFETRVRNRLAELELEHLTDFLGVCTGADKFAAFAEADVFCMPTFYENETFGIVFLEAMAYGLSVVATRWRGIPSVVDDGQTGFLVDIQDSDAVADRLEQLAQDPELRQRMGAAGRAKFEREFTLRQHIGVMRSVFLDVAGETDETPSTSPHLKPTRVPATISGERLNL